MRIAEKRGCLHEVPYKDDTDAIKVVVGVPAICRNRETLSEGILLNTLKVFHEDFKISRNGAKFLLVVRTAECFSDSGEQIESTEEATIEDETMTVDNNSPVKMKEMPDSYFKL